MIPDGWFLLVQEVLRADPFSSHLFVFRGKRASMLKSLLHDGSDLCLFAKRLDQVAFTWTISCLLAVEEPRRGDGALHDVGRRRQGAGP